MYLLYIKDIHFNFLSAVYNLQSDEWILMGFHYLLGNFSGKSLMLKISFCMLSYRITGEVLFHMNTTMNDYPLKKISRKNSSATSIVIYIIFEEGV